jgi:hypothetical protein
MQHRGGRADDITVQHNRRMPEPRGDNRAGDGGDFAAAETAQDFKWIVEMVAVQSNGLCDRLGLPL